MPPASTAGVAVNGSGTIKVYTATRSFTFSVSTGSGTPSGTLSYVDAPNNKNVAATQITSVVVNGTDIRIFGKATINDAGSFDFAVTAKENSQVVPAVADTFSITLSDGYASGNRALASGDIAISPAP
jgi:VCBS repeat-containing protein